MIAIIAGCGANIASVQFALERLGYTSVLTTDPQIIQSASHVILPGVGTAKNAMQQLQKLQLIDVIVRLKQPVLGICLGMQIMQQFSAEGNVECLGIFPNRVEALPSSDHLTIPHIGWNQLIIETQSPLLNNIPGGSYVYFVHSYAVLCNENTIAKTDYGNSFSAIVQKQNFYGVQFHPERSGKIGSQILRNFFEFGTTLFR